MSDDYRACTETERTCFLLLAAAYDQCATLTSREQPEQTDRYRELARRYRNAVEHGVGVQDRAPQLRVIHGGAE